MRRVCLDTVKGGEEKDPFAFLIWIKRRLRMIG
jgi:hypothetical protein